MKPTTNNKKILKISLVSKETYTANTMPAVFDVGVGSGTMEGTGQLEESKLNSRPLQNAFEEPLLFFTTEHMQKGEFSVLATQSAEVAPLTPVQFCPP